jgi:hypothetical protein
MNQPISRYIESRFFRSSALAVASASLVLGSACVSTAATLGVGEYSPGSWTTTSDSNATGSISFQYSPNNSANQATFVRTSTSGNAGATDWTVSLSGNRRITFDWAVLGTLTDVAVYLVKNSTPVATLFAAPNVMSPVSGHTSFNFNSDTPAQFGFLMTSGSSQPAAVAQLAVTNFSNDTDDAPTAVPFEFSPTWGLGLIGAWLGYRRWQKRSKS